VPISHLDLYRFQGFSAAEWGDLEPYFDGAIAFVEWPEAAADALPPARLAVTLAHSPDGHRRVALAAAEPALLERVGRRVDPGSRYGGDDSHHSAPA
jgi:tRNA A37 threonylcarbamoyladenosine biosynthesis protein TsaE